MRKINLYVAAVKKGMAHEDVLPQRHMDTEGGRRGARPYRFLPI
jgi:hypothetical protein